MGLVTKTSCNYEGALYISYMIFRLR